MAGEKIFSRRWMLRNKVTRAERNRIRQRLMDSSRPSGSYYLLICLSAIIASYGLLANSTAVVIGAMLVAPLMGPIFGIALSLSIGDRKFFFTALRAEAMGIALAVSLPLLIGTIPLHPDFGTEIMARTQPTIYDVVIALASGLAGAYALVNEKISSALPGVAIATALVPPLAVCGLNLAEGSWQLAWGAFLLFAINFIAIEFAAASLFIWNGVTRVEQAGNGSRLKSLIRRLGLSFVILLLAAVTMTHTLVVVIRENQLEKEVRQVLTAKLSAYAGARLTDVKYDTSQGGLEIRAVVVTPQEFDPDRVAVLEDALRMEVAPRAQLILSSVITKDSDRNGPVFISADELKQQNRIDKESEYMNRVSMLLSAEIDSIKGAQIIDITKDVKAGIAMITVSVRTPAAILPAEVKQIQEKLTHEIDPSIQLVVRSILTQDADANRFLNETNGAAAAQQEADAAIQARLLNEVTWFLTSAKKISGLTVEALEIDRSSGNLAVYATVNTPQFIDSPLVAQMQKHLQASIGRQIVLTVKSILGGTVTTDMNLESGQTP